MTRKTEAISAFSIFSTLYVLLYTKVIPSPEIFHDKILPVIPWWLLVSLGAYSLGTLGIDVMTFHDKPEAHKELVEQIKEAQDDLASKGFVF